MATTDHYDVIIIGSGAGGGTLAWRLAPSGKRILLLERGGYLPRERDNWETEAVFLKGKYLTTERWLDVDGNELHARAELLRRRQHQVLRRGAVPAAARGLRRDHPPRRHLAGVADLLRRLRAVVRRRPRSCTTSTARPARTRPTARAAATTRIPPVEHEPRIQQLSDDLEALGLHPSHLPIGVMLDQDADGEPLPEQPVHPLRPRRRLPVPRRRQGRRPGRRASIRRWPHPQPRARHQRQGRAARDRRQPAVRSPRSSPRSATAPRPASPATSSWCRAARSTRRCCCCARPTTPTRPAWPTAPTRSGATTCATTTWP